MYNFTVCKICSAHAGRLRYKLSNANVFVCSRCGFHYTDYLDSIEIIEPAELKALTVEERNYIKNDLQHNKERFRTHVDTVRRFHPTLKELKVLDIGCGGGLFLFLLKHEGADVLGTELNDTRIAYAQNTYGVTVRPYPVEHKFWQTKYHNAFDVVTLWDVIEHVNFPVETLRAAVTLLKPGGHVFLDTPCRDAFYHRVGSITYWFSMGQLPTFLNSMYSNHCFGHKQIFTTGEIRRLFNTAGLETLEIKKFHELSFPYEFYLKKLLKSSLLVTITLPMVKFFFKVFKIKNKILAVGKKRP